MLAGQRESKHICLQAKVCQKANHPLRPRSSTVVPAPLLIECDKQWIRMQNKNCRFLCTKSGKNKCGAGRAAGRACVAAKCRHLDRNCASSSSPTSPLLTRMALMSIKLHIAMLTVEQAACEGRIYDHMIGIPCNQFPKCSPNAAIVASCEGGLCRLL